MKDIFGYKGVVLSINEEKQRKNLLFKKEVNTKDIFKNIIYRDTSSSINKRKNNSHILQKHHIQAYILALPKYHPKLQSGFFIRSNKTKNSINTIYKIRF